MHADIELIVLPYAAAEGRSVAERLIAELHSGRWLALKAAVAFAKQTGNFEELLAALEEFARHDGRIDLTFGADRFAGGAKGTDYEALETLLDRLSEFPGVRLHVYHERGRTFHPKIYLFSNDRAALLILGSSNWSDGGLIRNVEANVVVNLDLTVREHRTAFEEIERYFAEYWTES